MRKPVIAITMGDPAGIGPELIVKALAGRVIRSKADPLVIGDAGVLNFMADRLKVKPLRPDEIVSASELDIKRLGPGRPTVESARAMISYVEEAVYMAAVGDVEAVVTCPINKDAAQMAGFGFPGHTEFIAHLTGAEDYAMMLGGDDLKVILVTIHEPIKKVPGLITIESVLKTLKIADASFRMDFGLRKPRIAVCGLNPHAGEGGIFGSEDMKVIAPAVKKARSKGINAIGPLPADTVFYRTVRKKEFDCVVAMYHDQGLGPLKLLHFEDGVNATLGLPIVRTSVDHGTAYDVAWKGIASTGSLVAAVRMAAEMALRRR